MGSERREKVPGVSYPKLWGLSTTTSLLGTLSAECSHGFGWGKAPLWVNQGRPQGLEIDVKNHLGSYPNSLPLSPYFSGCLSQVLTTGPPGKSQGSIYDTWLSLAGNELEASVGAMGRGNGKKYGSKHILTKSYCVLGHLLWRLWAGT